MTNTKTTKRALLSSVVALFLCFAMLLGTTYAWFTDEVTSANNTIVSGNLNIELYHSDNLANEESVDGQTVLFDAVELWEPGAMVWEELTVKNEGSLALKYQLALNVLNATEIDGVSFTSMLKVAFIEDGLDEYNRASVEAISADKWQTLETFMIPGELEKNGDSDVYGIVIWWQPTDNDNLFNMNNENKGKEVTVEVGVRLFATQLEAEFDSFGNDYDAGAPWTGDINLDWYDAAATEYVLDSADELAGLAAIVNGTAASTYSMRSTPVADSFAGKTIKLGANIDMNDINWTPIGTWANSFAGTFDGQGYTISNLYINQPAGDGVGFFGVTDKVTIKNVNFVNVDVYGYSEVATVAGYAHVGSTISNCHVSGTIRIVAEYAYAGGISAGDSYYSVDGCSVIADGTGLIQAKNRNAVGGITAWMCEGANKITNCQVKNLDLIGWTNIGGISGFIHYSNVIDGCTVENVNIIKTREGGAPGFGAIAGGYSYSANNACTITNNTVKNVTMTGASVPYEKASKLYGSEYGGATSANFVLENNIEENVVENNLVVDKFVANAAELQAALDAATGDYVIYVTADITGDVIVTQKADTAITVYGNNKKLNGLMTVFGNGGPATAALTIKNINFVAKAGADSCILSPDRSVYNKYSYSANVTVEGCTFTDADGVVNCAAVRHNDGGDKNWKIIDCTVDSTMHSLIQTNNVEGNGLLIEGCTVNSKNGINLNQCVKVDIIDCDIDVKGYAVRFGAGKGSADAVETFLIKDCTLKSANDDGDAVIIFRVTAGNSTLTIENTTIEGTPDIDTSAATNVTINR